MIHISITSMQTIRNEERRPVGTNYLYIEFRGSETEAGQLTESIKFQLHEGLMCRYCYLFRFYSKTSKTDPTEAAE